MGMLFRYTIYFVIYLGTSVNCSFNSTKAGDIKNELRPIKLVVIVPSHRPYLFRKQMVLPAVEYAVASSKREMESLGFYYDVIYKKSYCSKRAAISAIDVYSQTVLEYNATGSQRVKLKSRRDRYPLHSKNKNNEMHGYSPSNAKLTFGKSKIPTKNLVFLGPACNDAASSVLALADYWNVPVITSGAPTVTIDPNLSQVLTRIGSSHYDLAQFIRILFSYLKYGYSIPIHLVYERWGQRGAAEDECALVIHTLSTFLPALDRRFHLYSPKFLEDKFDAKRLVKDLNDPKIIIMCASSKSVRKILIAAYVNGRANPSQTHWYAIDMHNRTGYIHGAWRMGDESDSFAKEAFKALMVITTYSRKSHKYNAFREAMLLNYRNSGITEDVNDFVTGFHDAVILHKEALKQSSMVIEYFPSGSELTTNIRNMSVAGILGPVMIGEHGDRKSDYSILCMTNYKTGTFSSVYDYLGATGEIKNGGLPVLHLQEVGKVTKLSNSETNETIAGLLGTICGILLCCALVFGPLCYCKRTRTRVSSKNNRKAIGVIIKRNSGELNLHRPLQKEESAVTWTTSLEDDVKL